MLGLALLGLAGWIEGPTVVRQVTSLLGLQRVESHAEILREAARESGLDPCLLAGVMYVESRGKVGAESSAGALGLLQLMPAAASDAAERLHLPAPTRAVLLTDARLNARLGANHLKQLFRSLGRDPERVLVAYNAGRGRLLDWERAAGGWSAWRAKHAERGDSATLAYAQDVLAFAERFRERGVVSGAAQSTRRATPGLASEVGPPNEVGGAASDPSTPPSTAPTTTEGKASVENRSRP
ncbi:MAG: transglycosylase SLT domain-containing protein [Planctomycetes bacterium]|nr:transglycosylase SLT domain-containing protein [Planctomycetota bacterium]